MNCSSCGASNTADAVFCEECGASFGRECPSCGASCSPRAKFCRRCRTALGGDAVEKKSERDPRSYTPKHLAEKILTSRSALEGERKQVTVLFADVKGSMDLAESIDAEEWHGIMERFFQILSDGVHRFEGTVNQYTGDGIMALFGAPIAHEDHAQRACYTALTLQEDLRRYANELRLEKGINFSVRMGLNSGEVVVGKIGDDLRMDYTALGHTASLGARMEQISEPGKAYLTEHTAKLVEGFVTLHDLGRLALKGVKEPIRVYELQGIGKLRTRLEVSRARGFARFIGRTDEITTLEAALARAIEGTGQVIGVVGDPGLGKSRLCFEFAERCRARQIPVYEAHGLSHGKAIPWLPVLEFFRGYFGIAEHDAARIARDKIAGRMLLLDETLVEGLPLMFDFLGVPDPERPTPPLDPEARQRQFFDVIRRLARARSARETAVLLFEDLHWFDRALRRMGEALTLARGLDHAFSLAFALTFSAFLRLYRREYQLAREQAAEALKISTEHSFLLPLEMAAIIHGWALAETGQAQEGVTQIRQGIADWRAVGQELEVPHFLGLLAEAYGRANQPEQGLEVLTEALTIVDSTGERFWEAELRRMYGELSLRVAAPAARGRLALVSAEESFLKSIEIARGQHAKSLELRAVMSLSRLLEKQSKKEDARQLLAEIYGWFTEGFDTADLKDAKALLEELS